MLFGAANMIKSSTSSDGGKKKSTLQYLDLHHGEERKKVAAKKKKKKKKQETESTELPQPLSEWERTARMREREANSTQWRPAESFLARLDALAASPNTNTNGNLKTSDAKTGATATESAAKAACAKGRGAHQFLFALWALQLSVDRASYFGQLPYELLLFVFDLRMRLTLLHSSTALSGYTTYQQRLYAEDFNLLRTIFRVEGQNYCELKNRYYCGCTYSATTTIMQLLRDNLTKWTSGLTDEEEDGDDAY